VKVNVLILSDKVKILDLLKGCTTLEEVGSTMEKINQASAVFDIKKSIFR
jgi:hypothetical protein